VLAYLVLWCRAAIAGVFLVSVASKLRGRAALEGFVLWAGSLPVLPRRWSQPVAYASVAAETGALVLLVIPAAVPFGLGYGVVLLLIFTIAIVAALRRGDRRPCRCFGNATAPLGLPHVIRNLALIAICATGLIGTAFADRPAWNPAELATTVLTATVPALLALQFDDLIALLASPGTTRRSS
jgi:Methylamine utilisation protein MauE